jgi:hypothetical protein
VIFTTRHRTYLCGHLLSKVIFSIQLSSKVDDYGTNFKNVLGRFKRHSPPG